MIQGLKQFVYRLLRRSEKLTKTDMVYMASGGSWLLLGHLSAMASSFALSVAFANLVPKEIYGTYRYVLSILGLLSIPTLAGMGTAVVQAVAQGKEGALTQGMLAKLRWGALGSVASALIAVYYIAQGNATIGSAFLIIAICLPLMESFQVYQSFLAGKKLFRLSSQATIATKLVTTTSLILALFLTDSLPLIIAAFMIPPLVTRATFFSYAVLKLKQNKNRSGGMVRYGLNLSAIEIIGLIAIQIDKILIFQILGPVQLAIYSFGIAIPEQLKGVFKNINSLAMPKLSQGDPRRFHHFTQRMWRYAMFLLPVIVLYIIAAPWVYKIFFSEYTNSIVLSQIFAVSLLAQTPFMSFGATFLQSQKAQAALYQINFIGYAVMIVLTIAALVAGYGILGVVIGRTIGRFITGGITYRAIVRLTK